MRQVPRSAIASCLALGVIVAAAGCGSSAATPASTTGSGSGTVAIAGLNDLTGLVAAYGVPLGDGTKLAVQDINAAGGFTVAGKKYTLTLDVKDSQSDANVALAEARGIVSSGTHFIVQGGGSQVGVAVSAYASSAANKVIQLTGSSVLSLQLNPTYVKTAPGKYTFDYAAGEAGIIPTEVSALENTFGKHLKIGMLFRDDPTGQASQQALRSGLLAAGYDVMPAVYFPPGTTDFSPLLARIKAQGVKVLETQYNPVDSAAILKEGVPMNAASMGYSALATSVQQIQAAVPHVPAGISIMAEQLPVSVSPASTPALAAFFKQLIQLDPSLAASPGVEGAATYTYNAVYMLVAAMEAAGTVSNTDKISASLARTSITGVLGPVRFSSSQILEAGADVCVVKSSGSTCSAYPFPGTS
jgi:branched-chain amino acid transport system substrate-binding protein